MYILLIIYNISLNFKQLVNVAPKRNIFNYLTDINLLTKLLITLSNALKFSTFNHLKTLKTTKVLEVFNFNLHFCQSVTTSVPIIVDIWNPLYIMQIRVASSTLLQDFMLFTMCYVHAIDVEYSRLFHVVHFRNFVRECRVDVHTCMWKRLALYWLLEKNIFLYAVWTVTKNCCIAALAYCRVTVTNGVHRCSIIIKRWFCFLA